MYIGFQKNYFNPEPITIRRLWYQGHYNTVQTVWHLHGPKLFKVGSNETTMTEILFQIRAELKMELLTKLNQTRVINKNLGRIIWSFAIGAQQLSESVVVVSTVH